MRRVAGMNALPSLAAPVAARPRRRNAHYRTAERADVPARTTQNRLRSVTADRFAAAVLGEPVRAVGLSALLTTTMVHMEAVIDHVVDVAPDVRVYVGGAPVTAEFAARIDRCREGHGF